MQIENVSICFSGKYKLTRKVRKSIFWRLDQYHYNKFLIEYYRKLTTNLLVKRELNSRNWKVSYFIFHVQEIQIRLTSKSLLSACIYLSIKSRMVNHKAVNVLRDNSGVRCCKNTYKQNIQKFHKTNWLTDWMWFSIHR